MALKWAIKEADSPQALLFQDDVRAGIHETIAPDVFAEEVAHVLTKAERKKFIPVGDAAHYVPDILKNGPVLHPFMPLLARAVEISSATRNAVTDWKSKQMGSGLLYSQVLYF